jgi:hypothetical protein
MLSFPIIDSSTEMTEQGSESLSMDQQAKFIILVNRIWIGIR